MKYTLISALLAILSVSLTACGKKSPLSLPADSSSSEIREPAKNTAINENPLRQPMSAQKFSHT